MMESTPTAEALVRAILADPADPLPRLVFADWLDDTDSPPNHAWAKYLRLAVDLVHLPLTPPRRAYLEAEQQRAAADVRAGLTVKAEQFLQHTAAFRQLLPLRCLTLNLDTVTVPPGILDALPSELAREHSALPLVAGPDAFVVAADGAVVDVAGEPLALALGRRVEVVRAAPAGLLEAIDRNYAAAEFAACVLPLAAPRPADPTPLEREADSGPVARVVATVLADAAAESAHEVTVERQGPRVEVRLLVAGARTLWGGLPERLHLPVVARLQKLAGLNLGAVEVDQIGTLAHVHRGKLVHFGVRVQPARSGPRATLTRHPDPQPEPPPELDDAPNPAA